MNDTAIQVEHLSKLYQLGTLQRHNTLRDQIVHGVRGWFQRNGRNRPETNTIWALKDVSFEVKRGEVIGIIGRNGAGKSTLLKILSRITDPTAGQATIYGRVASLLEVGTGFHSELTGRENAYMSGALLGMTKREIDRKFDDIVAFAEVEKFIDTPVKRYSSGMYVRLAFSVAAHLDTEILLVDEALAVGDAAFQQKCLGRMEKVASQSGKTVFFVSHQMAMIENICRRVIFLRGGEIAGDGEPRPVIDSYLSELSSLTKTSLADRKDRRGLGQVRIVAIELLDKEHNPLTHPASGQPLVIRTHFKCMEDKVFKKSTIEIFVHKGRHTYFLLSTKLVDKRQLDLHGEGYVDFHLPELALMQGTYHIATYVESNNEAQDSVSPASEMSVVDGDFYGTGKVCPGPGWQGEYVLVKYSWKLGAEARRTEADARTCEG